MSVTPIEEYSIDKYDNDEYFVLKGKDFTVKTNNICFNFWQYENEDKDYLYEGIRHDNLNPFELDLLLCDCDIEDIKIDEYDFTIDSFEDSKMKIICEGIENKDLEYICYSYEHIEEDFDLPIKYKRLTFTEFKNKFNLKGTKKQFIENTPEGFYLTFCTTKGNKYYYELNKEIEENFEHHIYECSLS